MYNLVAGFGGGNTNQRPSGLLLAMALLSLEETSSRGSGSYFDDIHSRSDMIRFREKAKSTPPEPGASPGAARDGD